MVSPELLELSYELDELTGRRPRGATAGPVWTLHREHRDFSPAELALAHDLQVVIGVVEAAAIARSRSSAEVPQLLTVRELEVLHLIAQGMSSRSVATALRISTRTVHKHLQNTYRKLSCGDRVSAINRARELGVL